MDLRSYTRFGGVGPPRHSDRGQQVITPFTLDAAVHLIQVALTPVFLLSGIAALMNVYAARLAKVSDRLDALSPTDEDRQPPANPTNQEISRLRRRLVVLDWAVVLGTIAAASTCMSILTLFLLALLSTAAIAGVLVAFFGAAIVCTLISVATFGLEMLISSRSMRSRMLLHWPQLLKGPGRRL